MRIVIAGGSGHLGTLLRHHFESRGDEVIILTRHPDPSDPATMLWDGATIGPWASQAIDGARVVINLAGRSVNCRYTEDNLRQMMDSRVESTRVVGEAIAAANEPPSVWLQMSTATIYAHRFDAPNDEKDGVLGGHEPDVPAYWARSIEIASRWEHTLNKARAPHTRRIAMRTAMVMAPQRDSVFDVLSTLTRRGLGGPIAGGDQFVSWVHGRDFVRALEHLIHDSTLSGPVNIAAPNPLPHRQFMAALRQALGVSIALPATAWMVKIGAWAMGSDAELVLKSRRVIPTRLIQDGFEFEFPHWPDAAVDLASIAA